MSGGTDSGGISGKMAVVKSGGIALDMSGGTASGEISGVLAMFITGERGFNKSLGEDMSGGTASGGMSVKSGGMYSR